VGFANQLPKSVIRLHQLFSIDAKVFNANKLVSAIRLIVLRNRILRLTVGVQIVLGATQTFNNINVLTLYATRLHNALKHTI
jgi:hypothetical protein